MEELVTQRDLVCCRDTHKQELQLTQPGFSFTPKSHICRPVYPVLVTTCKGDENSRSKARKLEIGEVGGLLGIMYIYWAG